MANSGIHVACFGFNERETSIIKSLIGIVSGRKKNIWTFQENIDQANVIIILATAPGAALLLASKARKTELRLLLSRPEGSFPPPHSDNILIIRHPLRSTELLETFDQLEQQWPFADETQISPAAASSPSTIAASFTPSQNFADDFTTTQAQPRYKVSPAPAPHPRNPEPMAGTPPVIPAKEKAAPTPAPPMSADMSAASLRTSMLRQQPASSIGQLVNAIELLRSPLGEQKFIDLYDDFGWFARVSSGMNKMVVSSHFAIRRKKTSSGFRWQYVKKNDHIPVSSGDTAVLMDFEVLVWLIARRFGRSMKALDIPKVRIHLTRWPDFGVFSEFTNRPGVMLATALLARKYTSVGALFNETDIAEKDLACLLAVCWLCGWLTLETEKQALSEPAAEEEAKYEEKRFSPIIRGLRKLLGLDRSHKK